MKVSIVLTFPDFALRSEARDVADVIAAGIVSDLDAIRKGGMTAEEAFGEGAVAPTSVTVEEE